MRDLCTTMTAGMSGPGEHADTRGTPQEDKFSQTQACTSEGASPSPARISRRRGTGDAPDCPLLPTLRLAHWRQSDGGAPPSSGSIRATVKTLGGGDGAAQSLENLELAGKRTPGRNGGRTGCQKKIEPANSNVQKTANVQKKTCQLYKKNRFSYPKFKFALPSRIPTHFHPLLTQFACWPNLHLALFFPFAFLPKGKIPLPSSRPAGNKLKQRR